MDILASFVMACGQGVLEVAGEPVCDTAGPAESSNGDLNLAQSFNAVAHRSVIARNILESSSMSREVTDAMRPQH